ncbi:MAG TPA: SH3 domain-containing protein [Bauldia sp.]|nr:SH3 domain-containing protein [Bauldia sp.]
MKMKKLVLGVVATAMMAIPAIAQAATGWTTGSVNMRTDAYVGAPKIITVPAHAQVQYDPRQQKNGWFLVSYAGRTGYVSGSYIQTRFANAKPMFRGLPPRVGFYKKPYWDNQHQAWYDGRRWYRNGIWYNSPSGFSFGFNFNGG